MNSDWKKYHGALITNQPPHILPKSNNLDKLIKDSKSYFCRWITDFDTKKETPFWYVINDTNFSLGDLSHKTRNQIKKGLKNCTVKIISKHVFINQSYDIYIKAFQNYKTFNKPLSKKKYIRKYQNSDSSYDFWGVYNKENKLIGFSQNIKSSDVCEFSITKFDRSFLKLRPSEALFFTMTDYYLNKLKFKYVHNGTRSISHQTNIQDFLIKKFKFRRAFCMLHIKYNFWLSFLVPFFFPFRKLLSFFSNNFSRKLSVLFFQEEIKRQSNLILKNTKKNSTQLILSNGNFKSGSTLVTAIIKELLFLQNQSFPKKYRNPKYKNWINRFKLAEFIKSDDFILNKFWLSKTHIYQSKLVNDILVNQENIKVVNIERDVKDVLVSHYYHLLNNKKIKSNFTEYFNSWGKYKAIQYIYYKKKWANYNFCLNLKYEDLINNKKDIILKIATYLDVKCDHIDNIINETSIESLRKNSKAKGLNESNWFYRKGEVGDWQNFFSEYMLKKLSLIEQNHLSIFEKINFFFKFTFRISIKYFLYRYFPSLYILFDKKF